MIDPSENPSLKYFLFPKNISSILDTAPLAVGDVTEPCDTVVDLVIF